jgi:peptide/nickel transport system substrate-binding protein
VKYTFDKLFASDSPKAPSFFETRDGKKQPFVSAIEAPDPRTVVFRMPRPWLELFASLVAVPVIPENSFEAQAQKPNGSGAFKFTRYDESQQVVDLDANDNYWEGAPRFIMSSRYRRQITTNDS